MDVADPVCDRGGGSTGAGEGRDTHLAGAETRPLTCLSSPEGPSSALHLHYTFSLFEQEKLLLCPVFAHPHTSGTVHSFLSAPSQRRDELALTIAWSPLAGQQLTEESRCLPPL